MSALQTLEKFQSLRAIPKTSTRAQVILNDLTNLPDDQRRKCFAQSKRAGGLFVYEHPKYPRQILEVIAGVRGDDSMCCLYEPHPMFNSPGEAVKAREELIALLESMHSAIPNTLLFDDEGRGRKVEIREMVTMQIVDSIAQKFRDKGF
jgi:hypothetical protein